MREQPELNEHKRWIIDEYQDFNPSEDHLLRRLRENADGVVIAGDDEQALYQTLKASDPAIIVGHYNDAEFAKAMLPFCTRCSYYICRAASAFMAKHRHESAIAKIYLPLRIDEDAERVHVVATAAPTGAVDYVRRFLEEHDEEYAAYVEQRTNGLDTDPFLLILSLSGGLTLTKKSKEDLELQELVESYADSPSSRSSAYTQVVAYATSAWYESDNFAWRKVLHYEGMSTADVHPLIEKAIKNNKPLRSSVLAADPETVERTVSVAALVDAAKGNEQQTATALNDLLGLGSDSAVLAKELVDHAIKSGTARLEEDEEATETVGAVESVAMMTITGSKGLSAHHVIVLGCDDINMGYLDPLPFFVALTRGRQSLHLIIATKANGAKEPHSFVLDLPEDCCEYSVYKKTDRSVELLSGRKALCDRVAAWAWQQSKKK